MGWQPATSTTPLLSDIDLRVDIGERVLLAGASGSGKSTLLRALAGLLDEDDGERTGSVLLDGEPPAQRPGRVGLLTQDPAAGAVAVTAGRDVAFGPENLDVGVAEVARRVGDALAAVGFEFGPGRRLTGLSGGERQRLALAGQLALAPALLLLDEPLAMLDPAAADEVRSAVLAAVADRSRGFVVVDHHLERWLPVVDRLVVLDGGRVVADGPPGRVLAEQREALAAAGLWLPGDQHGGGEHRGGEHRGGEHRGGEHRGGEHGGSEHPVRGIDRAETLLSAEKLGIRVPPPSDGWAVRDADVQLSAGHVTALTGRSGAGKSTALAALAGLDAPAEGTVRAAPGLARGLGAAPHRWNSKALAERIAWAPQNPAAGFLGATTAEEVELSSRAAGRTAPDTARLLAEVGLGARSGLAPRRLSGGEQRRLAVVTALATRPPVLLLDEPTVGQDRVTWLAVVALLRSARADGTAIGVATHDRLLVDQLADAEAPVGA